LKSAAGFPGFKSWKISTPAALPWKISMAGVHPKTSVQRPDGFFPDDRHPLLLSEKIFIDSHFKYATMINAIRCFFLSTFSMGMTHTIPGYGFSPQSGVPGLFAVPDPCRSGTAFSAYDRSVTTS
jgi:hypothetical protein